MKRLSKTGQSPGTPAEFGHSLRPNPAMECGEPSTPQQPKPVLSLCHCIILDTHDGTKPLLQAKAGPHHLPVPLLLPCQGPMGTSVSRETSQLREPAEWARPRPTASPQEGTRAGHRALHFFKDHALCATETTLLHRCSPARRPISASAATPLILPKSSCSISLLQRVVVYFGMLFLFCKKYFVFV